jgi:hypothetical protein
VNLHVSQVRLKQRKVSHPSAISPSTIYPSLIPHLIIISRIFKISSALIVIMTFCRILFQKSGTKSRGDFTFCTATAILRCTFCPSLLPSAREMRDIVKNDLTA